MRNVVVLNKKEGITSLRAIQDFEVKFPEYAGVKIGFAGRLDPLASGVLILLIGDENKNKAEYEGLDKEYDFEVLFGISTDTYDVMGKIIDFSFNYDENLKVKIKELLPNFKGRSIQPFPLYSSKKVKGKSLFHYALNNKVNEITIPEKEIEIYSLKSFGFYNFNSSELYKNISTRINRVEGNFRQYEILKKWESLLTTDVVFLIGKFKVKCSSGTYVRSIANSIGEKLGIPSLCFSILRTRVGSFSLKDANIFL